MYDIDRDYDLWLQQQADLLRQSYFVALDVENLIEELEALIKRQEYLSSKAKKIAEIKSRITMPDNPYSLEEVLDENFLL